MAARAADGGAPRVTTVEDANAGVSASIAERREAEMREARAAANAAVEDEENAKKVAVAAGTYLSVCYVFFGIYQP